MEIEKNTPVADLMTNRAGMVKLAQLVFDKTAIPYMRAITVFGKRKINGYTAETIVDVTCGPRYY